MEPANQEVEIIVTSYQLTCFLRFSVIPKREMGLPYVWKSLGVETSLPFPWNLGLLITGCVDVEVSLEVNRRCMNISYKAPCQSESRLNLI